LGYNILKIVYFVTNLFVLFSLLACSGGEGDGVLEDNDLLSSSEQLSFYVDSNGICNGRQPCFVSIPNALIASRDGQFTASYEVKRPGSPPDKIIVMPGVYVTYDPYDPVFTVGLLGERGVDGAWKVDIMAENGPFETFISGLNLGPCIELLDNLEMTLSGFTITECFESRESIVNQDYAVYIQSYRNTKITIKNNVFSNNASEHSVIGISPYFTNIEDLNIRITGNLFVENIGSIDLDGFPYKPGPEYSANILIDNNILYRNQEGIWFKTFTSTTENILISVVHNTIAFTKGTGIKLAGTTGLEVKNNIVYGGAFNMTGNAAHHDMANNLLTNENYLEGVSNNIIGNPMFTRAIDGDFTPLQGSPSIDRGTPLLNEAISTDFYGNNRVVDGDLNNSVIPDIGAIEVF